MLNSRPLRQPAADLVRTERTLDHSLIITDHIESVFFDLPDAVQNQYTLVSPVKDDIAAVQRIGTAGGDDSFITARNEQRIHTVTLRLQTDGMTITQKFLDIYRIRTSVCYM